MWFSFTKKGLVGLVFVFCTVSLDGQNNKWLQDSIRARELLSKGGQLGRNGMHLQALDTFRASLDLRKKLYDENDYNLAPAYTGIGITYRELGQYNLALQYFELAEENYKLDKKKMASNLPRLYQRMGDVYRDKLDYNEALRYYNQALNIIKNDEDVQKEDIAEAYCRIAGIYYETNNYEKTLEICNEQIDYAYFEDVLYLKELQAYSNQELKNFDIAGKYYNELISLSEEFYENDDIDLAYIYLNYVTFLMANKSFSETKHFADKGFEIINKFQPNKGEDLSYCYRIYGDIENERLLNTQNINEFVELNREKLLRAIKFYKMGLDALEFPIDLSTGNKDSMNCISTLDCIQLLKLIADSYNNLMKNELSEDTDSYSGFLKNSLKYYNLAGLVIQKARQELESENSKLRLNELEYATFHKSVQTAYIAYKKFRDLEYVNQAFQNAERIKASSVFDKINAQMALENSLIPDSYVLKEKKLNQLIGMYQERVLEEKNAPSPNDSIIADYNNKLFETVNQKQDLMLDLETNYADYYSLKYSKSMLTVSDIQKELQKNEVLIEYILVEDESQPELFIIFISPENTAFIKQYLDSGWMQNVQDFFDFTTSTKYQYVTKKESSKFCLASHNLYKKLILPLSDEIKERKLIIVPDGKLNYVAFDALLQSLPDTTQRIRFNQLDYLVRNFSINYTFSANLLYGTELKSLKTNKQVLAFAPKYTGETYEFGNQEIKLTQLPGTINEVDNISKMLKTQAFKGKEATEENFRLHASGSEILHLAMHAHINDSVPGLSRFAFTVFPEDSLQNDGWLTTLDIYNLKLNSRLAVLSACNTGRGKLRKGEGVINLARGFLFAGCPSLIITLWEVEDNSGAELMRLFYKNLKKGKAKDDALRHAKLQYLENSNSRLAHPHYWLGYISIGDNTPIFRSYDYYFFGILVLLVIAIVVDQYFRRKKPA
jgi:CHAT domain-containing protein